jgi:hypothetical protein
MHADADPPEHVPLALAVTLEDELVSPVAEDRRPGDLQVARSTLDIHDRHLVQHAVPQRGHDVLDRLRLARAQAADSVGRLAELHRLEPALEIVGPDPRWFGEGP